jgi:hypothetical protein
VKVHTYLSEGADDNGCVSGNDGTVDEAELDRLMEDYVFEPTAWDLAMAIGIVVDPDADRAALDELADAMLVWAEGAELERLTDEAIDHLWDDTLAGWVRDGIVRLSKDEEWKQGATAALADYDRDPPRSEVAREVVRNLAMQLGATDHPPMFCLCCIDEAMTGTRPDERRHLARRAAILAVRNAAVPEAEVHAAISAMAREPPAARLATEARRAAVRARLGRLGELARDSMPTLSVELRSLAAEPLPERPEDDDVWEEACLHLTAAAARPDLN